MAQGLLRGQPQNGIPPARVENKLPNHLADEMDRLLALAHPNEKSFKDCIQSAKLRDTDKPWSPHFGKAHLLSLCVHYHQRINNFASFGHAFAEQACFPSFGLVASELDFDHCFRSAT